MTKSISQIIAPLGRKAHREVLIVLQELRDNGHTDLDRVIRGMEGDQKLKVDVAVEKLKKPQNKKKTRGVRPKTEPCDICNTGELRPKYYKCAGWLLVCKCGHRRKVTK